MITQGAAAIIKNKLKEILKDVYGVTGIVVTSDAVTVYVNNTIAYSKIPESIDGYIIMTEFSDDPKAIYQKKGLVK